MKEEIIYYTDELNDEFSKAKINPIKIDSKYKYHRGLLWELCSYLLQNIITMPIKLLHLRLKFKHEFIGKEKIKKYMNENKKQGFFIYANHTQSFADTHIPSMAVYPRRNFFIVNPENISMKGTKMLVEMLGAIPIPGDIKSTKSFIKRLENRLNKGYIISIYPEAHIWPYCTWIRNFKSVSFEFPKRFNKPFFTITNTYHKEKKKIKIISYIDGPFFPDSNLSLKEDEKRLRDLAYNTMTKESKKSTYEKIKYIKKEN